MSAEGCSRIPETAQAPGTTLGNRTGTSSTLKALWTSGMLPGAFLEKIRFFGS